MTTLGHYEDAYTGTEFPTAIDLIDHVNHLCTDELYGPWNVPVWITDDENGLHVGIMLTRHGYCCQWYVTPGNYTPESVRELESIMLNIWAGRAEHRFARHTYQRREG